MLWGEAETKGFACPIWTTFQQAKELEAFVRKSADKGMSLESLQRTVENLRLKIVPFDEESVFIVGSMREATRKAGLSLGDRACLALGLSKGLPVITTDKRWLEAPLVVEVILIR